MRAALPRFPLEADAAFRNDLRLEAQAYLTRRGDHRWADIGTALKAVTLVIAAAALYALALRAGSPGGFMASYTAFFFVATLLAINVLHDASHRALFRSIAANRWVARLASLPMGIDSDYWTARHVHYHHPFANVDGLDFDMEPNPFLRQSPFQPWAAQYRYQHLYWPLVAALSLPYINWVFDWADRLGRTPLAADQVLRGAGGWALFVASKALHFLLFVALPLHIAGPSVGWAVVLCAYLLAQMVASCVLVAMILGTHWADVEFFERPASGEPMPHGWYSHTFRTTCDWVVRPRWLGAGLGGLNLHLTHHLFPTYCHRHYEDLQQIVKRLAHRHGLDYRALGYRELVGLQQVFLRKMGSRPVPNADTPHQR